MSDDRTAELLRMLQDLRRAGHELVADFATRPHALCENARISGQNLAACKPHPRRP